jgi:hypothetical protein
MFSKGCICTLANVVIANPMRANLFHRSCANQRFATFDVAQAKEKSYHNEHPTNQFPLLATEIFGRLHKHANVFLHDCVNTI